MYPLKYWTTIIIFALHAISAGAVCKTLTETTILYGDSASLMAASADGWCSDGQGLHTFYFAKKGATFLHPETNDTIIWESACLADVKGKGATKGLICTFRGVKQVEICFRSGSSVMRYVQMDINTASGTSASATTAGHAGTGLASILKSDSLLSEQSYTLTLSGWADSEGTTGADCQIIYLKFMVTEKITEEETPNLTFFAPTVLDPENLDRGLIAYPVTGGNMVSWRLLGTDSIFSTTFNLYRNGTLLNTMPLTHATCYLDNSGDNTATYTLETLVNGTQTELSNSIHTWGKPYLNIPINRPADGSNASGSYYYTPGDASVGDVDGDGQYEIILRWDPSDQKDNSLRGYTGNVYMDCYKLNGTQLWRIDLGRNIRAGAHYTPFMVYDFDKDGKAEIACKTAPGTKDGEGNYVTMNSDNPTALYLGSSGATTGVVTGGPEYLTMFNGFTGAEITSVAYEPSRGSSTSWGKDSYFNRSERYLACVAYLDGQTPSLVMCRGYYQRAAITAYNFNGKNLTKVWARDDTSAGTGCYGEGAHSIAAGDVDGDGCDEIVFGSACIDNDGKMLYRTGFGHGDALHLGNFDPDREGLEIFMVHEETGSTYPWDAEFRDARTGEVIWGLKQSGNDIGRGLCADMDSTRRGAEAWPIADYSTTGTKTNNVFDCRGNIISSKRPSVNFRIYWMGNLYEQVLEKGVIAKWRCTTAGGSDNLIDFCSAYGCGVTLIKDVPVLQADLLGDWREEVILYDTLTKSNLMIFSTPYVTRYRVPCLMHDHLYRMSVCWQNVAYNQPPHIGFYLPDYAGYIAENMPTNTPNTATEHANIICTQHNEELCIQLNMTGETAFKLMDMTGRLIWNTTVHFSGQNQITCTQWSQLPSGIYMLYVIEKNKGTICKILKQL